MELQKDLISFLQDITNDREGWCGDHGVYTPQLTSKRVRYLLKSLQDLPHNTHMHMDSNKVSSDCVCKKCGRGPYINSGFADSCCQ